MTRWLGRVTIAAALALVLLIIYGAAIEPRLILDHRRYEVPIPGLPEPWRGAEVAVVSELQLGMWWANTGMVERAVQDILRAEPDVVLLGGDFVYGRQLDVPAKVDELVGFLRPLVDRGIPTFAVLGNHDYTAGAVGELTQRFDEVGIEVLRNESVAVPREKTTAVLHVVGVGAKRPGNSHPERVL